MVRLAESPSPESSLNWLARAGSVSVPGEDGSGKNGSDGRRWRSSRAGIGMGRIRCLKAFPRGAALRLVEGGPCPRYIVHMFGIIKQEIFWGGARFFFKIVVKLLYPTRSINVIPSPVGINLQDSTYT